MVITLNSQTYNFSLATAATHGFNLQGANTLGRTAKADVTYANLKQEC
jgi:hypothetical protein